MLIAEGAALVVSPPATGRTILMPPLAIRAARAMAHGRLESELRSIVRDLLGLCDSGVLSPEISAWVDHATDTAVDAACDRALEVLTEGLRACFEGAPGDLISSLNEAAIRRDAGIV